MLSLNEIMDQFGMLKSACWYDHVFVMAFEFEAGCQRRKWEPKKHGRSRKKVGVSREGVLCRSKWHVGVIQTATSLK